ncbi:hypothetical protein [Kribbella catacumbae]|uniref:hypothetical protein n=1 Tax=Kribbella catacumbae TaxID=460086 RepID=UPI000377BC93|nr:hypothetical protein [Kribbella catacumbae]
MVRTWPTYAGDPVVGGPPFIEPGAYHHIDGGLYSEGDDAWLVLHNDLYAKFRDGMEDIVTTTNLPRFQQMPYTPEPYLEGGVGAGHNNFFTDRSGHLWATFFRNPNFGYWSAPSRLPDTAVAGVVRLEWTGPTRNRLYVQRRRALNG